MGDPDALACALKTIWTYEDEANLPEAMRVVSMEDGQLRLKSDVAVDTAIETASRYHGFLAFCEQVDEVVDEDDPLTRADYARDLLVVNGSTPKSLTSLGLDDHPVCITERHLWKAMAPDESHGGRHHQHGLPVDRIKRLPLLIESPALVGDNPTDPSRLLVVLDETDAAGYPLVIPVKPDARGITTIGETLTNLILSVFGQSNFLNYFGGALTSDMVVRIDSSTETSLNSKVGRQVFAGLGDVPRDVTVKRPLCVKSRRYANLGPDSREPKR